jgi:hypothetical protein
MIIHQRFTILALSLLGTLTLALAGCGVLNPIMGDDTNMKTVPALWSDVPQIDGLAPSQMEMPFFIKLMMRTVIGNLGRVNKEDRTTGNIDWIVFSSSRTPQDIQNFYTNARMTANGWESSDKSTCIHGSEAGVAQVGAFCAFVKHQDDKQAQLVIIAAQDDQTRQTNVFFLRLEMTATPTENKTTGQK